MELYLKIADIFLPVFIIIGIGFIFGRKNPNFSTNPITDFAGTIGTPAMAFYIIAYTGITINIFFSNFIYALIVIFGFSLIGSLVLFIMKKDYISELPPIILPNTANFGIPICLFAYGTEGLGVAAGISCAVIFLHFTLGVFLAKKSFTFEILIKNPPFYAIIIALLIIHFDFKLPDFIENTAFLITYATIFLVLMSLGIALSKLKVISWIQASILGIVRVVFGPIIGFALIYYLELTGVGAGVLLIQSAMPSAILTYLVGSMYSDKDVVESISSVIVTSTIFSFFTLPIVVFYSLKFFQ